MKLPNVTKLYLFTLSHIVLISHYFWNRIGFKIKKINFWKKKKIGISYSQQRVYLQFISENIFLSSLKIEFLSTLATLHTTTQKISKIFFLFQLNLLYLLFIITKV